LTPTNKQTNGGEWEKIKDDDDESVCMQDESRRMTIESEPNNVEALLVTVSREKAWAK
jgi:hypothetical protein